MRSSNFSSRRGQEHFFAELDSTELDEIDTLDAEAPATSLWADAWRNLRRRPLFWISSALILLVLSVAAFPGLFTSADPGFCELKNSLADRGPGHIFGFDRQGCDIYARVIYGARTSVLVGVLTTLFVVIIGSILGAIAGYLGGWIDALLSRITDVFFAIPLVLAAIVIMQVFQKNRGVMTVVAVLAIFGWPQIARITRGSVMSVKNSDFVTAAEALGVSRMRTLIRHIMPNSAAPIIVTATVSLGVFIVAEATLSFLGIGLPPSVISWGGDISQAQTSLRSQPSVLFYPAGGLALTVLSFIVMGDVVRDALDPKARTR